LATTKATCAHDAQTLIVCSAEALRNPVCKDLLPRIRNAPHRNNRHLLNVTGKDDTMKALLPAACLVLLFLAPAPADANPYKHWNKHQEKLWKEQAKQQRKWMKEQHKYERDIWKQQEKFHREQAKFLRERAWRTPWFDGAAPQFGHTWPGGPHHGFPPAPQYHQYPSTPAPWHVPYGHPSVPPGYAPGLAPHGHW
jgi:hypothetical protein